MVIEWVPVPFSNVPPKGSPRDDEPVKPGHHRGARSDRWRTGLDAFLALGCDTAEAVYNPSVWSADSVASTLNTVIRRDKERLGHLRVIQRGDAVYLTSVPRSLVSLDAVQTLEAFAASGERERVLPGDSTLYRALHYRRTRLALGYIRVEIRGNEIRLIDTLIDPCDPT